DLAASLTIFFAATLWASFLLEPGWKTLLPAAMGLGLALVSKYSALFLLLVLPLLSCIAWRKNRGRQFFTWRGAILVSIVICLGAGLVIAAVYGPQAITRFHYLRESGYRIALLDQFLTRGSRLAAALGRAACEPAYSYLMGLKELIKHNTEG